MVGMNIIYLTETPKEIWEKRKAAVKAHRIEPTAIRYDYTEYGLCELRGQYKYLINRVKDMNGHLMRGENCDPYEAAATIDSLNSENDVHNAEYAFCLDVGACNLCGQNLYEFIKILGGRIKAVILRDNNGDRDSALLPFSSVTIGESHTDWNGLILGLRAIDFDGTLMLDVRDSVGATPMYMRKDYIKYIHKMGEYFVWQLGMEKMVRSYDKCVLFGAGNMCRAYMKCYKDVCPPLFTCDNNSKLWGSTFEDLEVKAPEELKNISDDIVIFICNMYYDEIAEQLRSMGIKNKVEYFSDEYMPSKYFDRIDPVTREIIKQQR